MLKTKKNYYHMNSDEDKAIEKENESLQEVFVKMTLIKQEFCIQNNWR